MKHIVKRQILELSVKGQGDARFLQAEMSRIYRHDIVPMLDKICTETTHAESIYRIESLCVDVGDIDATNFASDFSAKVGQVLRHSLAAQIKELVDKSQQHGTSIATRSKLELLTFFARSGALPWWADHDQPNLLDRCLRDLIQTEPAQLRKLITEFVQERDSLPRLIHFYDDGALEALLRSLVPTLSASFDQQPAQLITLIQATRVGAGAQESLRRHVWIALVCAATQWTSGGTLHPNTLTLLVGKALREIAVALATTDVELLRDLEARVQGGEVTDTELATTVTTLYQQKNLALSHKPIFLTLLADLVTVLQGRAQQLPPAPRKRVLAEIAAWEVEARQRGSVSRHTIYHLCAALAIDAPPINSADGSLPLESLREMNHLLRQSTNAAPYSDENNPANLDLGFSDANEIYVNNAGIGLLWPFLDFFFTHVGLLTARQFHSPEAQMRAAALLHYVSSGDTSPLEYLLPLNKLLCGLAATDPLFFSPPFTTQEMEACEDLLMATIAQAPILRNMSVDGLRGTFLLRPGVLTMRDGMWLLRVERESYDIVLDRFPWSWEWIKLPWMKLALRTEW